MVPLASTTTGGAADTGPARTSATRRGPRNMRKYLQGQEGRVAEVRFLPIAGKRRSLLRSIPEAAFPGWGVLPHGAGRTFRYFTADLYLVEAGEMSVVASSGRQANSDRVKGNDLLQWLGHGVL